LTQQAREIFETHAPSVMRKGVAVALQGDTRLLATFANRLLGPQTVPKKFGKLSMRTTDELMDTFDLVAKKLGAGEITLTEAQELFAIIEQRRKLIETHEHGKRLQDLEERWGKPDEPLDWAA
jgi:hypothetical protein